MIKFIITYLLEFLIGFTILTQIIIPLFIRDLKFFWFFKKEHRTKDFEEEEINAIILELPPDPNPNPDLNAPVSSDPKEVIEVVKEIVDLEKEAEEAKNHYIKTSRRIEDTFNKVEDIRAKNSDLNEQNHSHKNPKDHINDFQD